MKIQEKTAKPKTIVRICGIGTIGPGFVLYPKLYRFDRFEDGFRFAYRKASQGYEVKLFFTGDEKVFFDPAAFKEA